MASSSAKCVYLLCFTWPLMLANPIRHTRENQILPTGTKDDHTAPHDTRDSTTYGPVDTHQTNAVSNRVLGLPEYPCTTNLNCYPKDIVNYTIPTKFIHCQNQTCVCTDCFYSLNDSCVVKECHHFENDSGECVDERKSQKTVFLLSVFLSATGSANSYIGQATLGSIQASIFLLALLLCVCVYCTKRCFIDCCEWFEDECDCCGCCEDFWGCCQDMGATIFIVLSVLGIFFCCLAIIAWWVADIVAFSENTRLDGNGCPLKYDL